MRSRKKSRRLRRSTPRIRISYAKKHFIASNQAWKCVICEQLLPCRFHVDHIVPLSLGGASHLSNLQCICAACHNKKCAIEQFAWEDAQREERTGVSKYFDPKSFAYLK